MSTGFRYRGAASPKMQAIIYIVVGIVFVGIALFSLISSVSADAKKPDDAEFFKGKVTEVLSVDTDYKRKSTTGKKKKVVTVYDCHVIVEYEVNGQVYEHQHFADDRDTPSKVGDTYYVEVSPAEPEKVYTVSASSSTFARSTLKYILLVVFGIFGVVFASAGIKALNKKQTVDNDPNLWH